MGILGLPFGLGRSAATRGKRSAERAEAVGTGNRQAMNHDAGPGVGRPRVIHGTAQIQPGVRLHYVEAGKGSRTIVLLHGFPQTWWEWRHVIEPLAAGGWRVIAPDYRGAGASSKPQEGYDKRTMAADIATLLREHFSVTEPVVMVGHDIGMMVAYAFASAYPKNVERLVLMEAPLPGTAAYDGLVATPRLRNAAMSLFFFHNAEDNLAELLTAGRERQYLQHFYERLSFDQGAIGPANLDVYASAFAAAGAMRVGMELYRAFDRDADDNRAGLAEAGKLTMPVLALGGASSFFTPIAAVMLDEVAKHVQVGTIPRCGHWIAEENPAAFLDELARFFAERRGRKARAGLPQTSQRRHAFSVDRSALAHAECGGERWPSL